MEVREFLMIAEWNGVNPMIKRTYRYPECYALKELFQYTPCSIDIMVTGDGQVFAYIMTNGFQMFATEPQRCVHTVFQAILIIMQTTSFARYVRRQKNTNKGRLTK